VTGKDRQSGIEFAQIAAAFDLLPYPGSRLSDIPNLSQSALPQPFDPAPVPEAGIHLHWALPDAITHGSSDGSGPVRFPVAPDRWLVVRLAGEGSARTITSWVIESDHLWDQGASTGSQSVANDPLKQNAFSRAVPLDPPTLPAEAKTFCAMGRVFPSKSWTGDRGPRAVLTAQADAGETSLAVSELIGWRDAGNTVAVIHDGDATETVVISAASDASGPGTLELHAPIRRAHRAGAAVDCYAGDRHTALGYGTPAFAAAYPHCPNVFAFWDPADGLAAASLSYVVVGWYSTANAAYDPLHGVKIPDAVEGTVTIAQYRWAYTDTGAAPDRTICSGVLRGIAWDPSKTFVHTRKVMASTSPSAIRRRKRLPRCWRRATRR